MPVYAIVQLTVHNQAMYDDYVTGFVSIWGRFRGRLLAADSSPQVVEGSWERHKLVVLEFPDEAAFHEWYDSADYQMILKLRHAASDGVMLLVKGWPETPPQT